MLKRTASFLRMIQRDLASPPRPRHADTGLPLVSQVNLSHVHKLTRMHALAPGDPTPEEVKEVITMTPPRDAAGKGADKGEAHGADEAEGKTLADIKKAKEEANAERLRKGTLILPALRSARE